MGMRVHPHAGLYSESERSTALAVCVQKDITLVASYTEPNFYWVKIENCGNNIQKANSKLGLTNWLEYFGAITVFPRIEARP